jgi:hypothetical protein
MIKTEGQGRSNNPRSFEDSIESLVALSPL